MEIECKLKQTYPGGWQAWHHGNVTDAKPGAVSDPQLFLLMFPNHLTLPLTDNSIARTLIFFANTRSVADTLSCISPLAYWFHCFACHNNAGKYD